MMSRKNGGPFPTHKSWPILPSHHQFVIQYQSTYGRRITQSSSCQACLKASFPSNTCDRLAWHILQWAECYEDQWQDSACRICWVCWFCKGNITSIGCLTSLQKYSSPFFMQMLVAWATLSPSSSLGEILSLGDPKKKRSSATLSYKWFFVEKICAKVTIFPGFLFWKTIGSRE